MNMEQEIASAFDLIFDKADWENSYRNFDTEKCVKKDDLLIVHCAEVPMAAVIFNNSTALHIICRENKTYVPCVTNFLQGIIDGDVDYFCKMADSQHDIVFKSDEGEVRLKNIGIQSGIVEGVDDHGLYFI